MPSHTFCTPTAIASRTPTWVAPGTAKPAPIASPSGMRCRRERADDGVAAARLAHVARSSIVDVVAGLVAEVLVVAARVVVGNEAIHGRREPDARREPDDDQRQPRDVEPVRPAHVVHGLAEQAQRRRREHQPGAQAQDAVVGPARQLAHEQERQRAQAGRQPGEQRPR